MVFDRGARSFRAVLLRVGGSKSLAVRQLAAVSGRGGQGYPGQQDKGQKHAHPGAGQLAAVCHLGGLLALYQHRLLDAADGVA